ncbi:MAG TPA: V-type ATP synthase subunit B [Anaerolineae bacterium]|nr:V-type ATP synthase subunit B [Caldilineae bacterium]HID33341.1 V-type ATP synthase subunit B [Anaerolineae bacterium]HIQ11765.1 V-type ATP synthase subunit B [Caldilineales bacterium]
MSPSLLTVLYRTGRFAAGPLLIFERVKDVGLGEIAFITAPDGQERLGQVLELDGERAVIQVFEGVAGLDVDRTLTRFSGRGARIGVGLGMLGRIFDGSGHPIDGGPPLVPEAMLDVNGLPINPYARAHPSDFIQTGISAIDGLNTLVRGQKLPIFSGFGLPANELAAQIAAQAQVKNESSDFVVIFAALGITHREASFFRRSLEASGALSHAVLFLNLADDPAVERLLTPRAALTAAEFLAFEHDLHVLVILTDMTNYCEALREVATAREEVPGRRGYPGYMYTDLATLYERAGRIRGRSGSITQLIILTMPDDDITHPIPDLTGYITEGQIVLSRELHRKGVYPPIDVLPSLSRLMNAGIGPGKTREDHRAVADQLYAFYARGRDLRRLVAIIGEGGLTKEDRRFLDFANIFELRFIGQGHSKRTIEETLELAWKLLAPFDPDELTRIPRKLLAKRHAQGEPDRG